MLKRIRLLLAVVAVFHCISAVSMAETPAAGAAQSQNATDAAPRTVRPGSFQFVESQANLLFALSQYTGDCQIQMTFDPAKRYRITITFLRDGKKVLTLVGHRGSVFRATGNILYFAHFGRAACGCTVAAYDLRTGNKIWETELSAVGKPAHSVYSNQITMGVSTLEEVTEEGKGTITICGRESYGDYVETLDLKTGKVLGTEKVSGPVD
jgi:hypothetical protein